MGYYMRYFIPHEADALTVATLRDALQAHDSLYTVQSATADPLFGDLFYADRRLGELEINRAGDEIFTEEVEDLLDLLVHHPDSQKEQVITALKSAKCMVAVSAIWKDGDADDADVVHERIDPLWAWLDAHHLGILHCDADGFYVQDRLILEMNVRL